MLIAQDGELFFDLMQLKVASNKLNSIAQTLDSQKLEIGFDISSGDVADKIMLLAKKYNELGTSLAELVRDVKDSVDLTREGIKNADNDLAKRWKGNIIASVVVRKDSSDDKSHDSSYVKTEEPEVGSIAQNAVVINNSKISYKDMEYNSIPNVKQEYFYNQNDYSKFTKSNGKNVGCTATAEAIAYSIYHNESVTPDQMGWSSGGATWNHSDRIEGSNYMNASQRYSVMFENLTNGKPVLVRVPGHHVTAVGIREGANVDNLGPADFLIVDPYTGKLDTLADYGMNRGLGSQVLDTDGWSLRVPK